MAQAFPTPKQPKIHREPVQGYLCSASSSFKTRWVHATGRLLLSVSFRKILTWLITTSHMHMYMVQSQHKLHGHGIISGFVRRLHPTSNCLKLYENQLDGQHLCTGSESRPYDLYMTSSKFVLMTSEFGLQIILLHYIIQSNIFLWHVWKIQKYDLFCMSALHT